MLRQVTQHAPASDAATAVWPAGCCQAPAAGRTIAQPTEACKVAAAAAAVEGRACQLAAVLLLLQVSCKPRELLLLLLLLRRGCLRPVSAASECCKDRRVWLRGTQQYCGL
jgi:hypothetical protein